MRARSRSRPSRPPRHPAPLRGPWGVVAAALAVTMSVALMLGADRAGMPRAVAVVAGVLVAVLSVAALPSLPTRLAATGVLAMGGVVVARYARLAGTDGLLVVVWVAGAVVTLVLVDRASVLERPPLGRAPARGVFARAGVAVVLAVFAVATALAPAINASLQRGVRSGSPSDPFADPASTDLFSFSSALDTRVRPRLSDAVVMTVAADRPAFWRGQVFDRWDGTTWSRQRREQARLLRPDAAGRQAVPAPADDPGVRRGRVNRQTFTVETDFAQLLFAAPTPISLRADRSAFALADATLVLASGSALGRGATYSVESREPAATEVTLRASAADPVPAGIAARYARPAAATARVRRLARRITAGAATPYDQVRAIEAWLGANTRYTLDAPLPPRSSADVVDWFVFESRLGWCEQIASTLAVMLREVGVPARIATGFAAGERDVVSGRYTVRERDAHAWVEVWFPGVGWQGFDPTADVPLAGEASATASLLGWLRANAAVLAGFAALVGVAYLFGPRLIAAARGARWGRTRTVAAWRTRAWRSLAALGARNGRPPRASDTPRQYARAVAAAAGEPALAEIGELLDAATFGAAEPDTTARARADAALARASSGRGPVLRSP